jgi:uncharacterized circularly permuted ATP-grasp superfamily protein
MTIHWQQYAAPGCYDELVNNGSGPRPAARALCEYLASLSDEELRERKTAAELAILVLGITFTVYTEGGSIDKAFSPCNSIVGFPLSFLARASVLKFFSTKNGIL